MIKHQDKNSYSKIWKSIINMFTITRTRQANLLCITATIEHSNNNNNNNNRPLVRRDKFIACNGSRTRIFGRPARRIDTTPTISSIRQGTEVLWCGHSTNDRGKHRFRLSYRANSLHLAKSVVTNRRQQKHFFKQVEAYSKPSFDAV